MGSDNSHAQYIHMVQHLIEECLLFNMSRDECVEALSKHANINPIITSTVWKELEKENKEFFETYTKRREENAAFCDQTETSTRIKKILLDSSSSSSSSTKDGDVD